MEKGLGFLYFVDSIPRAVEAAFHVILVATRVRNYEQQTWLISHVFAMFVDVRPKASMFPKIPRDLNMLIHCKEIEHNVQMSSLNTDVKKENNTWA